MRALLEGLQDSSHTLYAQRQNSSLSEEFSELLPDVGPLPTFAEAFGAPPEATNIWIGDPFHFSPSLICHCSMMGVVFLWWSKISSIGTPIQTCRSMLGLVRIEDAIPCSQQAAHQIVQ